MKTFNNCWKIFSFYKFLKSFVFLAKIVTKSGHRRYNLPKILLVFSDFSGLIQWQKTWDKIVLPTFQFLNHPNEPAWPNLTFLDLTWPHLTPLTPLNPPWPPLDHLGPTSLNLLDLLKPILLSYAKPSGELMYKFYFVYF